jgi:hypothetical protein
MSTDRRLKAPSRMNTDAVSPTAAFVRAQLHFIAGFAGVN